MRDVNVGASKALGEVMGKPLEEESKKAIAKAEVIVGDGVAIAKETPKEDKKVAESATPQGATTTAKPRAHGGEGVEGFVYNPNAKPGEEGFANEYGYFKGTFHHRPIAQGIITYNKGSATPVVHAKKKHAGEGVEGFIWDPKAKYGQVGFASEYSYFLNGKNHHAPIDDRHQSRRWEPKPKTPEELEAERIEKELKEAKAKRFKDNFNKVWKAMDFKAMERVFALHEYEFEDYADWMHINEPGDKDFTHFWQKDNDSNVLLVGHLDSVAKGNWFRSMVSPVDAMIWSPVLDDRLGIYTIIELLPKLGIKCDLLLCTDEEKGRSTAQYFNTDKQYNWIAEFDRMNDDAVLYQYTGKEWRDSLEASGFKIGHGSCSDISKLGHLKAKAVNIGVGYKNYHSEHAYADLVEYCGNVARFIAFYEDNKDTHFEHETYVAPVKKSFGDYEYPHYENGYKGNGYGRYSEDYYKSVCDRVDEKLLDKKKAPSTPNDNPAKSGDSRGKAGEDSSTRGCSENTPSSEADSAHLIGETRLKEIVLEETEGILYKLADTEVVKDYLYPTRYMGGKHPDMEVSFAHPVFAIMQLPPGDKEFIECAWYFDMNAKDTPPLVIIAMAEVYSEYLLDLKESWKEDASEVDKIVAIRKMTYVNAYRDARARMCLYMDVVSAVEEEVKEMKSDLVDTESGLLIEDNDWAWVD